MMQQTICSRATVETFLGLNISFSVNIVKLQWRAETRYTVCVTVRQGGTG